MADVYVASETAIVDYDGVPMRIKKGSTRVEAGHPLLAAHPDLFKPADEDVQFRVEDSRDDSATGSAYSALKQGELKAEIAKRNEGRDRDDQIVPAGKKNDDLVAALEADDAAQLEKSEAVHEASNTPAPPQGDPDATADTPEAEGSGTPHEDGDNASSDAASSKA